MTSRWKWLLPLVAFTLVTAGLLVHLASDQPDGLETVAERHGFAKREAALIQAPLPDYALPWHKTALGKSLVGLAGALGTFALVYGLGAALRRRRADTPPADASAETHEATAPPSPRDPSEPS